MYNNITEDLPATKNVTVCCYLQSWKYFQSAETELRKQLTLRTEYLDRARLFLHKHTPACQGNEDRLTRVAIHVRRTDYLRAIKIKEGWKIPGPEYFEKAMDFFRSGFKRVQFVVLSDDIRWCQENIRGRGDVVYSTGNAPVVDWAIASLCDHAIITIGTFGFWVAWFADGITITPRGFPAPNSWLAKVLHREDFYKPEWLAM